MNYSLRYKNCKISSKQWETSAILDVSKDSFIFKDRISNVPL